MEKEKLRVDKYLWSIRLFKTRRLATDACNDGKVKYEGENARVYAAMGVLQLGNGNPAEAIQLLDHAYMMDSSIAQELQQQLQNFSGEPQRQLAGWLLGHRQPQ